MPAAKRVETDDEIIDADVLVIALGAELHPEATPGLVDGGHEYYTVAGAFAAQTAIEQFAGGEVIVAVTSTPFKCPPAPSETALMMHDYLLRRGLRDASRISLVMPLPVPIPPSPSASEALLVAFAERDIAWHPQRLVRELDAARSAAVMSDGTELPYDLFLAVPTHRAPQVVVDAGLTSDGWIPVDPRTLQTSFPDVFAVGDVTSVGTPKAGVFAEGQATVVADRIAAVIAGEAPAAEYGGTGVCWLEFGDGRVGRVEVTFQPGQAPSGEFEFPSQLLAKHKEEFGTSRAARWFGTQWRPLG